MFYNFKKLSSVCCRDVLDGGVILKYKVKIVERLVKVVSVEADDSDEAEWKVQKMYNSEQIILYPENIASVDFVAFKSRK